MRQVEAVHKLDSYDAMYKLSDQLKRENVDIKERIVRTLLKRTLSTTRLHDEFEVALCNAIARLSSQRLIELLSEYLTDEEKRRCCAHGSNAAGLSSPSNSPVTLRLHRVARESVKCPALEM
jgi:hypothetical protein